MNCIKKRLEANLTKEQTTDFYKLWFSKIAEQTQYTNDAFEEMVNTYKRNKDVGNIGKGLSMDDINECIDYGMYKEYLGPKNRGSHKNLSAIGDAIDANKKLGNELSNLYQIYSSFADNYEKLPDDPYVEK